MKYGNMIYFQRLNSIGGIETWFYNISVLYGDLDVTVIINQGSAPQISRLQKNVRVIIWDGKQTFECERLFVNFNLAIIPFVKADKIYGCLHGDYMDMVERKQLSIENLPLDSRIDEYIGVSQVVCDSWFKLTGIKATLCYNPVLPVSKRRVVKLCSAQRLTKEKGKDRIKLLAGVLDNICRYTGDRWMWDIYTDDTNAISNENVYYRSPRLDVTDFYGAYDWFVLLSDNEGYCYSAVESLMRGVPCVVTDIPVFKELGLTEGNSIKLNLDTSNIYEVGKKIFTEKLQFDYEPPKDIWRSLFADVKSTYEYKEEKLMLHKVEALDTYERLKVRDAAYDRILPKGFQFEVDDTRLHTLLGNNKYKVAFVKEVEDEVLPVLEEPKVEEAVVEPQPVEEPKKKRGRKKKEG